MTRLGVDLDPLHRHPRLLQLAAEGIFHTRRALQDLALNPLHREVKIAKRLGKGDLLRGNRLDL